MACSPSAMMVRNPAALPPHISTACASCRRILSLSLPLHASPLRLSALFAVRFLYYVFTSCAPRSAFHHPCSSVCIRGFNSAFFAFFRGQIRSPFPLRFTLYVLGPLRMPQPIILIRHTPRQHHRALPIAVKRHIRQIRPNDRRRQTPRSFLHGKIAPPQRPR